jgi:hypothetical protein
MPSREIELAPGISRRLQTQVSKVQNRRPVWSIVSRDEVVALGCAKHQRMVVDPIRFAGSLAARENLLAQVRTRCRTQPQLDGART